MQKNEELHHILQLITDQQLGQALTAVENYLLSRQQMADMDTFNTIREEHRLMLQYWQQGYADSQRENLYGSLLKRLYVFTANLQFSDSLRNSPLLMGLYRRTRQSGRQWGTTAIRQSMEDFVSSQAMLQLEPEHTRKAKSEALYKEHAELMNDLFDYIITTKVWSDGLADVFEEILQSPTIDAIDQLLIVSAITLSSLQTFDFNKFKVLARVYQHTSDASLRQRALVGWALSLDETKIQIYPEMRQLVKELCSDDQVLQELTELQMQLVFCREAENDGRKIMGEIMPDLMKGSRLRITRQGIEEMDEDSLEDILHPETAEENMERMEQSVNRMAEMQRQGSDIYFGGFSQMKRFPFFNHPGNWFLPFYNHHPAVNAVWEKSKGKRFLEIITRVGAFCNSDKYSFVLAFNQVLQHIPQSMLDMIEQGEASPMPIGGEIDEQEQQKPAFIRRMYLQDLYRFFRLFPSRSEFLNPFVDAGRYLFFANPVFHRTSLQECFLQVVNFLVKRQCNVDAQRVLDAFDASRYNFQFYMLKARLSPVEEQRIYYNIALHKEPSSLPALAGYARACFNDSLYAEAIDAYRQLTEARPDKMSYKLSLAASLANEDQMDEAESILFELNYLHPEDLNVVRVLAWTLMSDMKYEQAQKYYDRLLALAEPSDEDLVNAGFCLWFSRRCDDALQVFHRVGAASQAIRDERVFLKAHGMSSVEIQMMLESLARY